MGENLTIMYRPRNRKNINQENSETVCENNPNMLDTAAIVNRKLEFDSNFKLGIFQYL